ncbi:Trehalose/maltose transport system permease protein MalG [uncultured archaeon]|nr:Trehalose/maltose transport system permease protein MalG [uncultured archaeon]
MDRTRLDSLIGGLTKAVALLSVSTFFFMLVGLLIKSGNILSSHSLSELLFSTNWSPSKGNFGFYPFITGTLLVTLSTMAISVPLCLMSAIYLTEYSGKKFRSTVKTSIDTLAGIPSVVFGLWGVLFVVPLVREVIAPAFGAETSGYCILSGALVLGIMVVPIMLSIMKDVIGSVPQDLKESSFALGATRWQTMKHVVLPKTAHGLFSAVILGFSRAFGETMAVLMVVGNVAVHARSVFDPAYPLSALIANNYGEMLSIPLYDSALMFAALLLLVIVVVFNVMARSVLTQLKMEEC